MAATASTEPDASAQNPSQTTTNDDNDTPLLTTSTSNKRPRIEQQPSQNNDKHSNDDIGRVVSNEGAASCTIARKQQQSSTPEVMVIDITDTPATADNNYECQNNVDAAVQIKRDPVAAALAPQHNNNNNDDVDDDSEVEVITPSRLKKPTGAESMMAILQDNDDDDDDIQITSSTLTAPNVVFPHHRYLCGVHKFTPLSFIDNSANAKFCPKCYCLVCDVPASKCTMWERNMGNPAVGPHCHAHNGEEKWVTLLKAKREAAAAAESASTTASVAVASNHQPPLPRNPYQRQPQQGRTNATNNNSTYSSSSNHQQIEQLIHNEFLSRLAAATNTNDVNNHNQSKEERVRSRKEMRIPEVLAENFQKALKIHEEADIDTVGTATFAAAAADSSSFAMVDLTSSPATSAAATAAATSSNSSSTNNNTRYKMEGDIPTLSLTNFFVMGIKIGWPYPTVMSPQRQMAFHLIKALNSSKHVVLESPTGTGKSAAILCSVLAWQRHHWKKSVSGTNKDKVKIIYCSRTHSQVAQMVTSLKQTPYRPRMAILGSRERLCIHQSIKPRGGGSGEEVKGVNVNNECRMRVRNTEKSRKHQLTNPTSNGPYDDDDPPDGPGDGDMGQSQQQQQQQQGEGGAVEGGETEENSFLSRSKTCPHYRQLSTSRVANLIHSAFVPNKGVDCCSIGGKESKFGAHDIEDLVQFGVDPNVQRGIALYRKEPTDSLGLSLKKGAGNRRGCYINKVKENTPAAMNGSLQVEDRIVRVNGNDVFNSDPAHVSTMIKGIKEDPVVLDVTRGGSGSLSSRGGDGDYSPHAACPYYVSQMLSKDAEIVFAPYNYVLDPAIRDAMGIELANTVVVLDEAHNVETVLRDAGSGRFGEIELCDLIVMLNNYAIIEKSTANMLELEDSNVGESETAHLCEVAHALLLFVEKIVDKLRDDKKYFESNPGKKGAAQVLREGEKFHKSDDSEFDISFDGPTGHGRMGKAVGCRPFFDKLGLTESDFLKLTVYANAFEKFLRGRDGNDGSTERDRISNLLDRLLELIGKMNSAINESCHYYAAVMATANGSLEFAANGEVDSEGSGRWQKRKPKPIPLIPPRTQSHPNRPPNPCMNQYCRSKCTDAFNPIRHGSCCDGSTPRWEAFLCLELLTPGPLMQQLANECRTVVLASGSLAPIPSLCAELNLFPADVPVTKPISSPNDPSSSSPKIQSRLQNKPAPLEAGHVIDLDKQLRCISIGHFPDGSELKVSHNNYKHDEFLEKLGDSLVRIVAAVPEGGVLVFFPSYALLKKCEKLWNPRSYNNRGASFWMSQRERDYPDENSVWNRLKALKHNVIVESSGSQDEFEERKAEYMNSVKTMGGCVLLAVYRGKMSEGISFNDNNARAVVCVGLPLPNSFVLPIKVKMDYNDEQRKIHNRTDLLPGREWYNQQAYRAIAQALGRCIRHIADYGAIFLLDIRHCDDGSPNNGCPKAHVNLPKWMRMSVRNLSRNTTGRSPMLFQYASSNTEILGGWNGLKPALHKFFKDAKPHAAGVLSKSKAKINASPCPPLPPKATAPPTGPSVSAAGQKGQPNAVGVDSAAPTSAAKVNTNLFASSTQTKPSIANKNPSAPSNTLQAMFQKQREATSSKDGSKKPPIVPKTKKTNTTRNLVTLFEKQREASLSQEPSTEESPIENESATNTIETNSIAANTTAQSEAVPTHVFKKSPFAEEVAAPDEGAVPVIAPRQGTQSSADDEHLCVVCEDAKKSIIILPCKHMCLCANCANFDRIKECPMCRSKVEDSMPVYW